MAGLHKAAVRKSHPMETAACQEETGMVSDALTSDMRTLALCLQNALDSWKGRHRTEDGNLESDCGSIFCGQHAVDAHKHFYGGRKSCLEQRRNPSFQIRAFE